MKTKSKKTPAKKTSTSQSSKPAAPITAAPAKPVPLTGPIVIRKEDTELPIAQLVPSADNRDIDPASLEADFLDSIRQWGVLERLWVFPLPKDDKRRAKGFTHEIIAGERRWCGAGVVGLVKVPVTIYHCTLQQADELRLVENLQRKQLTDLEEGRAFLRLRDKHGFQVFDPKHPERSICHALNLKEGYVYGHIRLVEAPKVITQALEAGKLTPSVALRLTRIADPKVMVKAATEFATWERFHGGQITDKLAAEKIEEDYQRQLKGAPFDTKLADLLPIEKDDKGHRIAGGACTDCPLRSGNQAELFAAEGATAKSRGDMCLNTACYDRKVTAAWDRIKQEMKKTHVLIPEDELHGIFGGWRGADELRDNCRYVFPTDKCEDDPKKRTYKVLIGEPHPANVARYLARNPRTLKVFTLFLRAECKTAIVAAGHKFYEAKSEEKRADNSAELITLREDALEQGEAEFRLAFVIDQLAADGAHGWHGDVFAAMCGALTVSEQFDTPERVVQQTLERWTPLRAGQRATGIAPGYIAGLSTPAAHAFLLEVALRRLVPYGGLEALTEAIADIAAASLIEVDMAWNKRVGHFAALRKANLEISVPATFELLKLINAARGPERLKENRPVISFQHCGRHYVNLAVAGAPNDCWEMVPVKAYDGQTHSYGKNDYGNEGLIVRQKGVEYALMGPRLVFYQRLCQCAKCGITEDFTGKDKIEWDTDDSRLCSKCAGPIGKAPKAKPATAPQI